VCSEALEMFRLLTLYLKPVLPKLAEQVENFLGIPHQGWAEVQVPLTSGHLINNYAHLMQRIDPKQLEALVAANKDSLAATPAAAPKKEKKVEEKHTPAETAAGEFISIDDFMKVDLRIAKIANAEHVEGADK